MTSADALVAAIFAIGIYFSGYLVGLSRGIERREERVERQRGIEVKHLLDHTRIAWWKR